MTRLNSSRQRLYEENSLFAKAIPVGSVVLDAGAGDQRYKHLFAHTRYEAADTLPARPAPRVANPVALLAR